nr:MAG TPA: hypothetical protein [Caudoviricetes sp.]
MQPKNNPLTTNPHTQIQVFVSFTIHFSLLTIHFSIKNASHFPT